MANSYLNGASSMIVSQGHLENRGNITVNHTTNTTGALSRKGREAKVLERLANHSPEAYWDRKDINPDRIEGTCDWFTSHRLFREWRDSNSSRMLWVSADPGCGKSVLARYLADNILRTDTTRTTCYFFFKDDFIDQKSIISALCCILHQLFMQRRDLLTETILEQFEGGGASFLSSFSQLWNTIIEAARDSNSGQIICILDAIDECEKDGRGQLSHALCKLYGAANSFNLKFLLLSRPYDDIRKSFQPLNVPGVPVIRLSGESEEEMEKISVEIDCFIEHRVKEIGDLLRLQSNEQMQLLQGLKRIPNRTYLWVYLTLKLIESDNNIDRLGISKALSQLPKSLNDVYNRILSRLESCDVEQARKLLQIVIAAERPLTLKEMNLALFLKETDKSYTNIEFQSEKRFAEYMRSLCGLFVIITDSRVYLLHQTAKEFLVRYEAPDPGLGHLEWKNSLYIAECHRTLTWICIHNLGFSEFDVPPPVTDEAFAEYVKDRVFLDYSAEHWTTHVRKAGLESDKTAKKVVIELCCAETTRCRTWFRKYWASINTPFPNGFNSLMILSYFGLSKAAEKWLRTNRDYASISTKDRLYGRSALSWAAGNGFRDVVKLLIRVSRRKGMWHLFSAKEQLECKDRYGRTPLFYAVWNRHVGIIEMLLRAGARTDTTDSTGGTPLSYAVSGGYQEITKLLGDPGAKVDSEATTRRTLLFSAVKRRDLDATRMLLGNGNLDPNIKDSVGRRALSYAIECGDVDMIEMLIHYDAHIEARYPNDGITLVTPLIRAVEIKNEKIVKMLIKNGADPNATDDAGCTPLFRAIHHRNERIAESLLKKRDVDRDLPDDEGRTPLLLAATQDDESSVALLLSYGSDPNIGDIHGRTPLSQASKSHNSNIVRMLLGCGAHVDSTLRTEHH
ncbi:hypothetical protein TWF694_006159 [Orbilia ellipsospora]|uniref:NACHT domain-containing protein n=1 Tax=Orbilia ellipsospora TaxID=2528407 RepID=A0AAV9WST4_9PEZI